MSANFNIYEAPFTSLYPVLGMIPCWVALWAYANERIKSRGVVGWASTALDAYKALNATVAIVLAVFILDIGHNYLAARTGLASDARIIGYIYHLFLIQAPIGAILQVLADGYQVNKDVAFVNLFLPVWSLVRIIQRPGGGVDWRLQAMVDCASRAIVVIAPRFIEDLQTETTMLALAEEFRWYGDLVMFAFWALFSFKGERTSPTALRVFGLPTEQELVSRALGAVIILYAAQLKRKQDKKEVKHVKIVPVVKHEKPTGPVKVTAAEWRQAQAKKIR